jgi:hypothetical protein
MGRTSTKKNRKRCTNVELIFIYRLPDMLYSPLPVVQNVFLNIYILRKFIKVVKDFVS